MFYVKIYFDTEVTMDPRAGITLRCTVCKNENYITTKNKRKHTERFEVKKYCPHCNKSTLHQEKK